MFPEVELQYKSGPACDHKTKKLRWEKDGIIWFLDTVFPEPAPLPVFPDIVYWANKYFSVA